jgi:GTP:adenosylcobinamide-phosphate guanylyltransferase
MSFLNLFLLGGMAAFSVPLVIHLLNRSRYRTVDWGAMHLLDKAFQANNKRIRIEQIILLLIRCCIPILLAMCLARPVLTAWRTLPGETPQSVVVLLDNSYSMELENTTETAFDSATDATCQILDSLKRGSELSVINMGGAASPVFETPIYDVHRLTRQLQQRDGGFGAASVADSFAAASTILSTAAHAQREVILVSDFQAADWPDGGNDLAERVEAGFADLTIRPNLTFLRVETEPVENISLQSLSYSRAAIGVGQTLKLRANIKNHDARSYASLRLKLFVDGKQQSTSQVSLNPYATSQVLFTHLFQQPGSHVVQVVLDHEDGLAVDNHAAASISVLERIEVLLVDGAPSAKPLEGETDFLAIALTPFSTGRTKLSDLVHVNTVSPGQIDASQLATAQVVVLANVSRLADEELTRLQHYVAQGGSLLLFPGDKTDVAWHNEKMAAAGLLPMPFGPLQGHQTEPEQQSRILAQRFDHPALQLFNDRSNGNLADGQIRIWYRLMAPADDARSVSIVARLANGDPLLVERSMQEGVVLQAATACDLDWSNLPTRPFFLPLMQEIVVKMATRVAPPRNIRAGDPLIVILPRDAEGDALTITTPDDRQITVHATKRGERSLVEFAQTQRPGVYVVDGSELGSQYFVSSASRAESDLAALTPEQLDTIAKQCGARVVSSVAERSRLEQLRMNGREIWRYVWIGVLGLMLGEVFLQQKFAGKR